MRFYLLDHRPWMQIFVYDGATITIIRQIHATKANMILEISPRSFNPRLYSKATLSTTPS